MQKAEHFKKTAVLSKAVLVLAAIGDLVFIGAVVPNIVQLLDKHLHGKHHSPKQIKNAYHNLKNRGLIQIKTNKDGQIFINPTKKGEEKLAQLDLDEIEIKNPKRWDYKWRILMFDLPVRFSKAREAFRWKIKDLGFFQLQKSVWIYPYPCVEELLFIADFFGITDHIEILTVEQMLQAEKLKRHFNLN